MTATQINSHVRLVQDYALRSHVLLNLVLFLHYFVTVSVCFKFVSAADFNQNFLLSFRPFDREYD